ncbi:M16 peptidase-like protein [Aureococcus anophagefferens]|nr:M16 peptidase-like protein [Aureococcus anophagefferens]
MATYKPTSLDGRALTAALPRTAAIDPSAIAAFTVQGTLDRLRDTPEALAPGRASRCSRSALEHRLVDERFDADDTADWAGRATALERAVAPPDGVALGCRALADAPHLLVAVARGREPRDGGPGPRAAAYAAGGDGGTASAVSLSLALVNEARLLLSDRHSARARSRAAVVAENAARLWRESGAAEYVDDALRAGEPVVLAVDGGLLRRRGGGRRRRRAPRGAAGRRGGRGARRRGVGAAQAGLLEEAPEEAALRLPAPPPPEETDRCVPGGGWANEPPCCVDCGDAHSTTDFIGSSCPRALTPASRAAAGLERLCAPRSSASDDRSYRVVRLANGVTCALVSDPAGEKAAAALSVGVGAYADRKDRAGLAHFLEHMLFQGTATYPADNA